MSEETNNTEEQVVAPEVQETATEAVAETVVETVNPQEFLANFDWYKYEEGIEAVDDAKLEEFETVRGTVDFVELNDDVMKEL